MNRQEALRQLPLRLTAGAFMLNSGFGKVWLLGFGLSLTFDGLAGRGGRR